MSPLQTVISGSVSTTSMEIVPEPAPVSFPMPVKVIFSSQSQPAWQKVFARSRKRREKEVCDAWSSFTEESRRKIVKVPTSNHFDCLSGPEIHPSDIWPFWNLDDNELQNLIIRAEERKGKAMSPTGTAVEIPVAEAEVSPVVDIDVESLILDNVNLSDVEAGIAAGYPPYMCRIEVGIMKLEDWLHHVELGQLRGILPSSQSLGDSFNFSGVLIRGFTLWRVLHFHSLSKEPTKVFKLWNRVIGEPIVDCLVKAGINANADWLTKGPPCLPALGIQGDI